MKILSLISALFVFIVLGSCRSDNDETEAATIVGVWQPISLKISGTSNGQNFTQTLTPNECQKKSRSTFNTNNTGSNDVWTDDTGTCVQQPALNFTYSYNAETKALSITSNGSTTSGTVSSLSATQLVYSMNSTYDYNGNNVPAIIEITANRIN